MGIQTPSPSALAEALFSTVQLRVLGLLFGQPDRSFQGAELIRLVAGGDGAVHRVLTRLAQSGLVSVTRIGNQKHYRANRESPIFEELHGLIIKTVGLAGPLQLALAPFARRITAAFVYGSLARGGDTARSDVDLMIIGDALNYTEVYQALQEAERVLHRPVNPTIYAPREFRKRRQARNAFLERVLAGPRVWLIGSDDALA
jgi:predicted nucleotidyltransferase